MNKLIKVRKGDNNNVVNARELHAFLGVKSRFATWLSRQIEKYGFVENEDFVSFSQKWEKPNGGRPVVEYALTLDMAKELSMVENNDQGRVARKYFINAEKELQELKENEAKRLQERQEARLEYPDMTNAIAEQKGMEGKDTKPYHFSNEANLINRIVLGCSASKWKAQHNLSESDSLRDSLSAEQIKAINHLQKVNTSLIETGSLYEDRKIKLTNLYQMRYNKQLVA